MMAFTMLSFLMIFLTCMETAKAVHDCAITGAVCYDNKRCCNKDETCFKLVNELRPVKTFCKDIHHFTHIPPQVTLQKYMPCLDSAECVLGCCAFAPYDENHPNFKWCRPPPRDNETFYDCIITRM